MQKCSWLVSIVIKNTFSSVCSSIQFILVVSRHVSSPSGGAASALAALHLQQGVETKNMRPPSLFFSLLESTVALGNPCKWDAARAVVTADVCSSCSGFTVHRSFFFLPVYEVSSASSFIIMHVSTTDSASVRG